VRKILVVLGMHRSGTSAITGGVEMLGFHLGAARLKPADDNPKGYFENRDVVMLNDRLLAALGSRWDVPGFYTPPAWHSPEVRLFEEEALQIFGEFDQQSAFWAVKDPRVCLTLPFWQEVMRQLPSVRVFYLHTLRHPLEVAQSQKRRNRADPGFHALGEDERYFVMLWHEYHRHAIQNLDSDRNMIVLHDELMRRPAETLREVASFIGIAPDPERLARFENEFIESDLLHHSVSEQSLSALYPGLAYAERAYLALRRLAKKVPLPASELREAFETAERSDRDDPDVIRKEFLGMLTSTGSALAKAHNQARNQRYQLDALRQRVEAAEQHVEALLHSTSWRITTPLRALRLLIRRAKPL
jgi:hypothetical protein